MSDRNQQATDSSSKPGVEGSQRKVAWADTESTSPASTSKDQSTAGKGSKTPHVTAKDLPHSPKQSESNLAESTSTATTTQRASSSSALPNASSNSWKAPTSATKSYVGPTTSTSSVSLSSAVSSPPISRLPDHMRRGNKSVRRSQHQSMIRECFSSPSPAYHMAYLSPYTPLREVQTSIPAAEDGESTPPGAADALPVVPISQTWQFSSAMRIKADLEYSTPYSMRIKFPMAAAESLLFFSSPEDGEITLSDLFSLSDANEITQDWLHSLISYPPLLRAIVRVAELITPVDGVLDPKSPCARVMDFLLDNYPVGTIMPAICSPLVDGTVALRHVLRRTRPASAFTPSSPVPGYSNPQQGILIPPALDHACNIISKSGADSVASIHAFRLVEATLSKIHTLDDMQQAPLRYVAQSVTYLLKNKELRRRGERGGVDAARRAAALQLLSAILRSYKRLLERVEAETESPEMPEEEWLLQDIAVSDIVQYLQDDEADPMVRCMALRVIHDFASIDLDEVPQWEHLEDVAGTCTEVMLWKTNWQHNHEEKAKSLDLVGFCPHDDAYHILSFAPSELVIRLISRALAVENKVEVLEPLLSLIVDHSALKDRYWPLMLSTLIHSGCLSFFHEILNQPVEPEEDADDRAACRAKFDACTGLTRCFEQMRARDMRAVPSDISLTLEKLEQDDDMPSFVRDSASATLIALNENVLPSFEISLSASLRSKTPADSSPRSPQPDSSATVSSSVASA
ncbi:hypothetical protein M407DRAFT_27077 [Tulasnella calospora MUT 4182]|uniref:Uncharacterized protein n=1 Tax=Tulasnella calospora MUT 4182 TaxID=1051891 RepID=A0A0C3LPY0_9AGAM|nr:hypothetical protein M407DRAFT_27077 [Tulasnella calospora MUT 4182]